MTVFAQGSDWVMQLWLRFHMLCADLITFEISNNLNSSKPLFSECVSNIDLHIRAETNVSNYLINAENLKMCSVLNVL
jgi:hypothetical protein